MFGSITRHRRSHRDLGTVQRPKSSSLSQTVMGVLEAAKGCWRRQDKGPRRTSSRSTEMSKHGNRCRIVVLGAPKVGKTNILRRFLGEDFEERHEPTTEDFHRKLFHVGGQAFQVDLLDASGERNFPAKRRLSILTGDLFLLVFSLDDRDSLGEVCDLLKEIRDAKAKLHKRKRPTRVPVVVCGNKSDLSAPRAVSRSEMSESLTEEEVSVFETSAKDGSGLEEMFGALVALGRLPEETAPARHQTVSVVAYRAACAAGRSTGVPCGAVDAAARRPSFSADLQMVLGSSGRSGEMEEH